MEIINHQKIEAELLTKLDISKQHVDEVLKKALELKGLDYNDVLTLLNVKNQN